MDRYIKLRDEFSALLEPKYLDLELKAWEFYINSTDENMQNYSDAEDKVHKLFMDEKLYNEFLEIQKIGLNDTHLDKQLKNLIKTFDEELNAGELKKQLREKENQIAAKYNKYVAYIDNKEVSKAEINKILETEKNIDYREKAYLAKIKAGDIIAADIVELVKLRNEFAVSQGYNNYFEYQLKEEYDVDIEYLNNLLNDVYNNAKDMSLKLQTETKQELAYFYRIRQEELKAHHYGLLLDNNPAKEINNSIKSKEQVVEIVKKAYFNMGYDIDNMSITLDLFPRKNKNTHGFCFEIEAGKDSRILANLTDNINSLDTLCHELGHCIYNLGIDINLPYLDKGTTPAMTEAVAMMMGDLAQTENILEDVVSVENLKKFQLEYKKNEAKFISRSMLIINFEREMYNNPNQNLGKLWHEMKCIYTAKNNIEDINNEWATIPHYLSHPAYYQNYFRATLIKAQMYKFLKNTLGMLTKNNKTAEYLNSKLFKYGKSIEENDLIKQFTGKPLSASDFCANLK